MVTTEQFPDLDPFHVRLSEPKTESLVVFPGSFNPMHEGHLDVLDKALVAFSKVAILQTNSAEKSAPTPLLQSIDNYPTIKWRLLQKIENRSVLVFQKEGFLRDTVREIEDELDLPVVGIIRGLRNGYDLQTEMVQQYWYEDLKMNLPIFYLITDRKYAHISSSAIRAVEKLKAAYKNPKFADIKGGVN